MKAIQSTKRTAALGLSALMLSSVMLCGVACTRNDHKNPGDTTAGGPQVTTPATGNNNSSGSGTDKPLSPDAGTVAPNGDAGDPPTGTGSDTERSILPRFMH
jgi:hypothetical protein